MTQLNIDMIMDMVEIEKQYNLKRWIPEEVELQIDIGKFYVTFALFFPINSWFWSSFQQNPKIKRGLQKNRLFSTEIYFM